MSGFDAHLARGHWVAIDSGEVFVRDEGEGFPVVCLHGLPTSSYVYRKVCHLLADNGVRALAPDLLGMGLSARPHPRTTDYSLTSLARTLEATLDELSIERCVLVLHDISGPIGAEMALRRPERIAGILALNTFLDVDRFEPAWPVRVCAAPVLGRAAVATAPTPLAYTLWCQRGIADPSVVTLTDVRTHLRLLRREDAGRALRAIVRGFDRDPQARRRLEEGLRAARFPSAVLWGRHDRWIGLWRAGHLADVLGAGDPWVIDAKHFLQEDRAPRVAEAALRLVDRVAG